MHQIPKNVLLLPDLLLTLKSMWLIPFILKEVQLMKSTRTLPTKQQFCNLSRSSTDTLDTLNENVILLIVKRDFQTYFKTTTRSAELVKLLFKLEDFLEHCEAISIVVATFPNDIQEEFYNKIRTKSVNCPAKFLYRTGRASILSYKLN